MIATTSWCSGPGSVDNRVEGGSATINGGGSSGTATIQVVTGSITIYNPDGTASDDGTVDVGDSVPMTVRLTSPAAVDGQFMLSYDTDCFKITTDAAGNNVVAPDTTQFTASTGGTQLYLWGVGSTSDPTGSQITLEYVEGDPQAVPVATAKQQVAAVTAGLDVTQALKYGLVRLKLEFGDLNSVQQANIGEQLIIWPYAKGAWEINTIKSANSPLIINHKRFALAVRDLTTNCQKTLLRYGWRW